MTDHKMPLRADFPILRPMPTRWMDNDHYGHVNNVTYYSYFDTTVNGVLMEITATDTRLLPVIGIVAETSCRFLKQLSFPDLLYIGLNVEKLGRSSVIYQLAVFRGDEDDPSAIGRFVHVYVDERTRRPIAIPQIIRSALERL